MSEALDLMQLAATLAREAGELIVAGRSGAVVASTKSSDIDIVTQMDLASERLLRERIAQLRPGDAFMGEEGETAEGSTGITWVVDPIDGTVNYLYGIPHFAVSIGVVRGSDPATWETLAGAVYDGSGVLWTAAAGHGAWRDGVQLRRLATAPLPATLLATGFQYVAADRAAQGAIVAAMLPQVRDIRRLGAASIDLCLVAAGTIDAYYEHGLKPWDVTAGALIATEAGVKVAGIDGGAPDAGVTIAAMPDVWEALRDALEAAGAREPLPSSAR